MSDAPRSVELSHGTGQHSRDGARAAARTGDILPAAPPAPPLLDAVGRATDWAVVAIGTVMIVLVFVNVCLHVVGHDLAWVTELAELLMIWVTFLGGACASRRGAQMTITEFIDKLHGTHRRLADATVDLVAIAVLTALVWYGTRLVVASWGNELTVLQIPMSFQYLGMPLGCGLMLLWLAWDLW
ncbi:MAG TPA: TRAP transporter small permease, partial [Casimicrobiaceae bacterium]|nr:TRAP transporter small permease [Casimicrobiaceae bacterium]